MIKIDLTFPSFSLKCVEFAAQFCFRCTFSFHEERRLSCLFDSDVIFLDQLQFAANEITSFCIDNTLRQMAFFRVRQSGQRRSKGLLSRMLKYFEIITFSF